MGGGGGADYSNNAFLNAFNAAAGGQDWDMVAANTDTNYLQVARMGFDMIPQGGPAEPAMPEGGGYEYTDPYAQQRADAEAKTLAEERARGIADRDAGYGQYLDAGNTAVDFVDTEIANERSNAALLGIDYTYTDEQRQGRINDKFSTLWSGENDTTLRNLMGEYGDPKGFQGFTFERGDGGYYDTQEGSEKLVSASGSPKPPTLIQDQDQEDVLGASSVLGV